MFGRTRHTLTQFLRRSFLTGLLVLVPSVLTLWLCWAGFNLIDQALAGLLRAARFEPFRGLGFILGFLGVLGVGAFANNFVGRKVVSLYETILHRLPVINQLFPAIRRISELVFTDQRNVFEKVVLVEYPRRGSYVIGFLAAETPRVISDAAGAGEMVSIFIPTTPNPTSGFLLLLPRDDVKVLGMTPEQGLKLVMSGGLLAPTESAPSALAPATLAAAIEEAASEESAGG